MSEEREMPDWVFTDTRPTTDKQYFENLTRCIFEGGLNWVMIANKWPNFEKAFDGFNIAKIAAYGLDDQERLKNDAGIISEIAAPAMNPAAASVSELVPVAAISQPQRR